MLMTKKLYILGTALAVVAGSAQAGVYSWSPTDSDLEDLDHRKAYIWGLGWNVPTGETIVGSTLTIKNIYDWRVEPDTLYVRLLDNVTVPAGGNVWGTTWDYEAVGDRWASEPGSTAIGTWTDPAGGVPTGFNLVFDLGTLGYLDELQAAIQNDGKFGFGFDPDCHYFNDGITLTITTTPRQTPLPDGGATVALLGCALLGLEGLRRKFSK